MEILTSKITDDEINQALHEASEALKTFSALSSDEDKRDQKNNKAFLDAIYPFFDIKDGIKEAYETFASEGPNETVWTDVPESESPQSAGLDQLRTETIDYRLSSIILNARVVAEALDIQLQH